MDFPYSKKYEPFSAKKRPILKYSGFQVVYNQKHKENRYIFELKIKPFYIF